MARQLRCVRCSVLACTVTHAIRSYAITNCMAIDLDFVPVANSAYVAAALCGETVA